MKRVCGMQNIEIHRHLVDEDNSEFLLWKSELEKELISFWQSMID